MTRTPEQAEFINQLTSHQRRLFGYIATLLPSPADTEEVLQQTNMILWSKADEFQSGTSFRAWSFRVAYLEVMAFQRRGTRERRLFSSELVETMSSELESFSHDPATHALQNCLEKLSIADRELVSKRYGVEATVKQLAESLGRPAASVYRSLDRIRYALLECIQRTLVTEDRS